MLVSRVVRELKPVLVASKRGSNFDGVIEAFTDMTAKFNSEIKIEKSER